MIRKILTYYAKRLDEYLSAFHHRPEGLATVGQIGSSTEEHLNKMVVSLLNVERETSGGISAPVQRTGDGRYARMQPPLLLNLNIMLAAVFDGRQYAESLSLLSDTMRFIQSVPKVRWKSRLHDRGGEYLHAGHEQCLDANRGNTIRPWCARYAA